jgi:hypothetical protein
MKAALRRSGAAAAAMSGSGSAVFGLFQKRSEAVHATDLLRRSWRVILTESLGRGEYERRSRPQRGGKSGGKHGGKSGGKERHRVARNPLSRLH